jgi:hypothetical protein
MGLYINAWGIKPEDFTPVFNSRDDRLLALFKKTARTRFQFDADERTVLDRVMEDYVYGREVPARQGVSAEPTRLASGGTGGYFTDGYFTGGVDFSVIAPAFAVIVICTVYRVNLPNGMDIKFGYETDLINQYLSEDFGIDGFNIEALLGFNLRTLKIPDVWRQFDLDPYECPVPGMLNLPDLRRVKGLLKNIRISRQTIQTLSGSADGDTSFKGQVYEDILRFIEDVNYCLAHKLRLFTVCG